MPWSEPCAVSHVYTVYTSNRSPEYELVQHWSAEMPQSESTV